MNRIRIENLLLTQSRGAMSRLRVWFYRLLGMTVGQRNRLEKVRCRNVNRIAIGNRNAFSEGCWLWPVNEPETAPGCARPAITIGDDNYFNRDVMLDACGQVIIGNGNMFGPRVYVTDSNHGFDALRPPAEAPMKVGAVRIGDRCWIGAHAAILSNVELGDNCVVAAGAVVTKSFPAGSVVAGVPAKLIRSLV